eukprot:TRINITY_DN105_c0_g2_i1.p1 TRINITY_DN105_c0_g2~~TRINITY_DN105_c0_g2_i1.p1  ORF type:complete len:448 (+),score=237.71 TRINITY_DN105_c0_g2_i1:99-1346(+)
MSTTKTDDGYDSNYEDEIAVADGADQDQYSTAYSTNFRSFLLKDSLYEAITDNGFEHPSEVQSRCLPHSTFGKSVICQAKSGMGKTAVFVISLLQQIDPESKDVAAIIVGHTRELAIQINNEIERFIAKRLPGIKVVTLIGKVDKETQIKQIRDLQPQIIVGTPGRLHDFIMGGKLDVSKVSHFVIDECDQVLQSDMRVKTQEIFMRCPKKKQVMLFTATLPQEAKDTCRLLAPNATEITVSSDKELTLVGLVQYYISLDESAKIDTLVDILDSIDFRQLVIFVKDAKRSETLSKLLTDLNFPNDYINGNLAQDQRTKIFNEFKGGKIRILVATDLMGRGIDVEHVNVVINFDMSPSPDQYLHRVGRAGRFGTKGLALSFIASQDDATVLNDIQKRFVVQIEEKPEVIDKATYSN